jgi:hypothetical protein
MPGQVSAQVRAGLRPLVRRLSIRIRYLLIADGVVRALSGVAQFAVVITLQTTSILVGSGYFIRHGCVLCFRPDDRRPQALEEKRTKAAGVPCSTDLEIRAPGNMFWSGR